MQPGDQHKDPDRRTAGIWKLVTPADGDDLPDDRCVALHIGATPGDVVVEQVDGSDPSGRSQLTIQAVAGVYLPGQWLRVRATGTTAATIHAIY